jgi:hypothetical protein
MKSIALSLCLLAAVPSAAFAQAHGSREGKFGAGIAIGNPVGGTAKYWFTPTQAVDAGVGFSGDFAFWADYLWHGWRAFPQPQKGELAARMGLGIRYEADDEFAFRTMPGVDYWLEGYPIELFAEFGPVFRVTPGASVGLDGAVGLRYYFDRFN